METKNEKGRDTERETEVSRKSRKTLGSTGFISGSAVEQLESTRLYEEKEEKKERG